MKTFIIWAIAAFCICMNTTAQGYGGRYGGRGGYGGGYRGSRYGSNMGSMRNQSQAKDYSQVSITDFPEIAGLTLKQKLDLSTLVTDEQKNILKLNDQKQELQVKVDHAGSQKDADKQKKKMTKIDDKIQKVSQKTDKKIQAILTNDQYREFLEKKDQIKFGVLPNIGNRFRPRSSDTGTPERREQLNQ